jgi:amidohydrolase
MKTKIEHLASVYYDDVVDMRRYLHAHPELSFEEEQTAKYIEESLKALNIPCKRLDDHAVVGMIDGKKSTPLVALRADMDALPVEEGNDVEYKSKNKGIMHACGHDIHMASLLGTAKILQEIKEDLNGSIKLIFQPAEEKIPGGAKKLIDEGVLENPDVSFIFGQHVLPDLETGKIGIKPGSFMASSDEIYITIKGRGGHAAMPWKLIDPVVISSQLVMSLQQISSRYAPANIPTVLSFGKVIANGANNIIPDEVILEGTFRTFDETWRWEAHDLIQKIVRKTVESYGAEAEIEIRKGYPALHNDADLTHSVKSFAHEFLGQENVVDLDIRMTAEDFAYFAKAKPAVFYRLGVYNKALNNDAPLHSSVFNPDEEALKTAMGFMAYLAYRSLDHE